MCISDDSEKVAFTVTRSHEEQLTNAKVVYNKVLVNVGNAYNPKTGEFTCPRGGVYIFTWKHNEPWVPAAV